MTIPEQKPGEAAKSPAGEFSSPNAVVEHEDLSAQTKRKILEEWEQDARQIAVASEEGMTGGKPIQLHEVKAAQAKLGTPAKKPAPNKSG